MSATPEAVDFLTKHLGQRVEIDLGDGYFVKIKPLSKGDLAACQERLQKWQVRVNSGAADPHGEIDFSAYQEEMVVRSLVEWNIDGPRGKLPVAPLDAARQSYRQLPALVADQIFTECDKLNAPPAASEGARFRDAGEGGAEGAADPEATGGVGGVLDGEPTLEGTGADA